VHRDADGAGLIGDGTGDGLADPPRCIRGEFVAAAILEFVHRFHEADVPFLDQVKELQPAVGVLFGDGDDKTQVGFNELALGGFGVNVALDDLTLRAPEFLVRYAGVLLQLFLFDLVLALDAPVLALGLLNARGFDLFFPDC
jgi:hypothetical protein